MLPGVLILIILLSSTYTYQVDPSVHKELLQKKVEELGIAIVELLRNEYDVPYVTKESFKVQFQPSIGISVDPDGTAKANESMVYLWTPNNNQSAFLSMRDLMYGKLGDPVFLPNSTEGNSTAIRQKRAPKGGGGGGRGGGGGFRGGAGGGRGSSAARSASRAGMSSAGGASFGSGIGGVRPHVWLYVGSNSRAGYSYQNDEEYERDKDVDSTATRMEISLCFGKHKSRESCSAKVDAMMEKLSTEHRDDSQKRIIILILLCVFCCCCSMLCGTKQQLRQP